MNDYRGDVLSQPHLSPVSCSDICATRVLNMTTAFDPLYVAGFGETTCSEVYAAGTRNYSVPEDSCPSLRRAIGDTCCAGEYTYNWYVRSG